MFVWRKRAGTVWLAANEATLREVAGRRLAIISRPGRKNAIAEIAGSNRPDLESIRSFWRHNRKIAAGLAKKNFARAKAEADQDRKAAGNYKERRFPSRRLW